LIVATAGHVDHGKTSLVRNLTGVETDRLDEEQRRGLSISLGYAYWQAADGATVGFIDVPGHRRFINNMISGVSGIDLGLLVVAADDGPMPQTLEHVQVMRLLGVERYLLVISKIDRVDEQRLAQVRADAATLLPEGTPVHMVSNTESTGIAGLKAELERQAKNRTAREAQGHFRMSIDRAFHLQGRGLVLTGTIASGDVATGDTVRLQPQGEALRVRSIHTQDAPAESGRAGERCALNVSGDVHKDDIERGDWVAGEGCIDATARFDTRIELLPQAPFPLKHLSIIKLHIGAKYLEARLILLDDETSNRSRISPGETLFAQLVTDRPILCCRGDRFLIRDFGETETLGGGVILEPRGSEKHKSSTTRLRFLAAMEQDNVEDAIREALENEQCVLDYGALLKSWNLDPDQRPGRLLRSVARVETSDGALWLARSQWDGVMQRILETLRHYHADHPDESGIDPARLARLARRGMDRRLLGPAIDALEASGDLRMTEGLLSASDFAPDQQDQDDPEWLAVKSCLREYGRQIPNLAQLRQECGLTEPVLDAVLDRARRDGRLVRVNADRFAETAVVNEFAQAVLEITDAKKTVAVAECRDRLGCGRNVLIEVLEYFDSIGFTRRVGNARIVLDRGLPENRFAA
jgi:selenocysteine-specific elongation factor